MNIAKPRTAIVINAAIWAAMILATSYLVAGVEGNVAEGLLLLHIVGWLVTNSLFTRRA